MRGPTTERPRRLHGLTLPRLTVALAALALALVLTDQGLADDIEERDPANIEGTWSYRTRSNCGSVEGVGQVSFIWDGQRGLYQERGQVFWSDSWSTIRWWGTARLSADGRWLEAQIENSLGDRVEGRWELLGAGPDQLVIRWSQTNGCFGQGVATRPRLR